MAERTPHQASGASSRSYLGRSAWAVVLAVAGVVAVRSIRLYFPGRQALLAVPGAVGIASQLLPWLEWRAMPAEQRTEARRWIAWWALAFFVSDLLQIVIGARAQNLWLALIVFPIEDACLLMACAAWQLRPVLRLTYRLAIPATTAVFLGLAVTAGEVNDFLVVSGLFRFLVMLTALSWTLLVRSRHETGRIWERDWLWISLGALLYYGTFVAVNPVSAALLPEHVELARLVYVVKGAVDAFAFVLVWKGMRCPVETSSPSTWPPYSPLSSS